MVGELFAVSIDVGDDAAILRLSGDVNRFAADHLGAGFREACATGASRIGLDFTAVDYLNSTGVALIVGILRDAQHVGLTMLAWGLSEHFRELFEITRIVDYMPTFNDQTAALESG